MNCALQYWAVRETLAPGTLALGMSWDGLGPWSSCDCSAQLWDWRVFEEKLADRGVAR
jgi:hypothetical protein